MINISLPDDKVLSFAQNNISGNDIAIKIGASLAKVAIAITYDGVLHDLVDLQNNHAKINIITTKDTEGLDIIRHSTAHLFGQALKQLYPQAKMVIGPVIEHGFYYDIDLENKLNLDDLSLIEKRMQNILKSKYQVKKKKSQKMKQ